MNYLNDSYRSLSILICAAATISSVVGLSSAIFADVWHLQGPIAIVAAKCSFGLLSFSSVLFGFAIVGSSSFSSASQRSHRRFWAELVFTLVFATYVCISLFVTIDRISDHREIGSLEIRIAYAWFLLGPLGVFLLSAGGKKQKA